MIKLKKGGIPSVLSKNAAEWTRQITNKLALGQQPTDGEKGKYSHPDVKAALVNETAGKCAFCESKIRHVSFGDIEHVVPKKLRPDLWFEWDNLTLACDVCNTNKGIQSNMVDPYGDDPEKRFIFFGPSMFPVPADEQAMLTERVLKLNRSDLLGRRVERLERLRDMIEVISRIKDPSVQAVLKEDFKEELKDFAEYAAMSRAVAKEYVARGLL